VRGILALLVAVAVVAALVLVVDNRRSDDSVDVGVIDVDPTVTPPPEISVPVAPGPPSTAPVTSGPIDPPVTVPPPETLPPVVEPPPQPAPTTTAWTDPDYPPPGAGSSPGPLGTPSPPPGGSASYAFTGLQDDGVTPIRYDPCRPLRYVVRPDNAPPEGDVLLAEAFETIRRTTGLQPAALGATGEVPSLDRSPYQPDLYGQQWAPVLVAWATPTEIPELDGDVLGVAGSVSAKATGLPSIFVTGTVYLDGPQLAEVYAMPNGGRDAVRSTIEHELGHVVGLAHVDDPTQLMYPQATGQVSKFQAGDLAGLAILGEGPCVPQI
jgi:hypothetical protein